MSQAIPVNWAIEENDRLIAYNCELRGDNLVMRAALERIAGAQGYGLTLEAMTSIANRLQEIAKEALRVVSE